MLKIPLNEEYGYRLWYWFYPGTEEGLIRDWKDESQISFFNPSSGKNLGFRIVAENSRKFFDDWKNAKIKAHVHGEDDTYLEVKDGVIFRTFNYPFLFRIIIA
jgi:hypothetical protein